MPKKGENIYKRRDGRWEDRYIRCYDVAGKATYGYVYGKTYGDVKDDLVQKKADAIRYPTAGSQRAVNRMVVGTRRYQRVSFGTKLSGFTRKLRKMRTF